MADAAVAACRSVRTAALSVEAVRRELSDTVTLELRPLAGQRPAYEPGQFNMLYVFGVGEVAISMSGDRTT